jgi:hypothetical protein
MQDERRKIEYAKKRLRRNYRGDELTSGNLTVGKVYQISVFGNGDDFSNVGAQLNTSGGVFKATGTTPTKWSNGSVLNEIKLDDLKTDADIVFETATDTVTLTTGAFEGGSGGGQITFAKDLLGTALEELIEELDPGWTPAPRTGTGTVIQFAI